jgi:hypothetical protein
VTIDGDLEPVWSQAGRYRLQSARAQRSSSRPPSSPSSGWSTPETFLYIGVKAWDSDPGAIVAGEMERDAPLYRDDSIAIVSTPRRPPQRHTFETTFNGARFDALIATSARSTASGMACGGRRAPRT